MGFGTYRQYDSRWGRKNYNGSSTYAQAACGATACANILHAINASITPLTTGKYMQSHGYAIRNQGTAWAGIPACLKAFGAKDVRQVDKMSDVFSYCSKGYVGVFLFRGGSRGGVTWTTSGHYIAVTGYKHVNGKHYFRTFDSGGRRHDGWYCYETTMKGLIPRIWLCKVVPQKVTKPSGKYSGTIPKPTLKKGSKGGSVEQLQKFLNWYHPAWKLAVDGVMGSGTESALASFQFAEGLTADGIYGKNSYAKAKAYECTPPKTTTKTPAKATTPKTPAPAPTKSGTSSTKAQTRQKMSKIGHAMCDYDHKAGDSSGNEVKKSSFTYKTSSSSVYNWTYVFRPKDIDKANKAADMCEKAIKNNNIGYNKNGETAYGKAKAMSKLAKAAKYDLSKINVKCGLSCGDLICLCNRWAGLSTCYIGSGKQLAANLKKNKNFQCIKYKKGTQLYRGDTLITAHSNGKNNHVVMCL